MQYSHARESTIESRTIFTLCKACKALWDSEPGLQDTFRGTPVHAQVPGRRPEGVFGRLRRLPDADEPIPDASLPDPGQPARQGGQAGGTVRWDGCRCAGETAIRFPRASRSGPGSGRQDKRRYAAVCHALAEPPPEHNGHAFGVDRDAGQVAGSDGGIYRMYRGSRRNCGGTGGRCGASARVPVVARSPGGCPLKPRGAGQTDPVAS